ncbi:hypothetical protein BD324DRAFT_623057 [Kockovaella imperatae]|uniref:Transcription initiation factor TFIID subunit 2 n=1 Tax=Kockovaella imperatae TaxID=4999 RepID=A0A1Y1UI49_9TREE|nr:hypothetical protein BD324DRAFT_623057 [Kockovaella imperatae]ORX37731.1 hypothetical protein BD324DRAFT_623057 [Kockovaella imperatae]
MDLGYSLSHQRVVLDIALAGILTGTAYLTINPTSPSLRTIYLHASPLLQIRSITLSSPPSLLPTPASYTLSQPFQALREGSVNAKSHTEIKRKTWAAQGERDEGELAISVSGGWIRLIQGQGDTMTLAPIEIQIDYRLNLGGDVVEGIVFERDHMYLSPTAYNAARIWTPCVDSLWERCTWELEFIVPARVDDADFIVVSSGELIEQTTHPHSPSKTIFYYLQSTPTSVQHIAFAAGPFQTLTIAEAPKPILGFCLPGDLDQLTHSTAFLPRAMTFYSTEYGSYPFTEYKVVFVGSPRIPCFTSATLSILSSDLLHPPSVIDQAIETRQILSLALIQQWVGINIIQRTVSDTWVIHGLALYLQSLFLKHLLGTNEYRFRLKRDIDRCVRLDQGDRWPICMPGQLDAPDIGFINLKAPLVMHILDRHLAKAGTSLGLARVIPRIFLAALSDELPGNTLSTQFFFRTCRKVSGVDLQAFQDQWVFASGCPRFKVSTHFIRKKFLVEFHLTQLPLPTSTKRPAPFFEGSLTVRIHEADGAPFEHVVDVKTASKTSNLPFNTKYKRTRRSGNIASRFSRLRMAEAAEEEVEELNDKGDVFAYQPWDDEEERERWRVAEWTDEQAEQMMGEGGGYEWIRIDPDFEWLAAFEFAEKPWYWISQLQGDRDVAAQLEAIQNMSVQLFPVMASELARTVLVPNYFYRVRMEAANALINFCNAETDYLGTFLLPMIFKHFFCEGDKVRPNDFSDFAEYFLKKAIIGALSGLREPATRTSPIEARQLLLHILASNDNTENSYSDAYYLATLITAIGNAFSATRDSIENRDLLKQGVESIERIMTLDRLVPSFHNVITEAGLKTRVKLVLSGHLFNDSRPFLGYTREGNFEELRLTAFDCLLLCRPAGKSTTLINYFFDVIMNDPSLNVRRHVARAVSESISLSLALGDVKDLPTSGLIETNVASAQRENEGHNGQLVKLVRKDFGKIPALHEGLQGALLAYLASNDDDIRLALIKTAELTLKADEEPAPGTTITISTPVVETPATTPRIRLSLSGSLGAPIEIDDGYPFPSVPGPIKLVIGAPKKVKAVHKSQKKGLPDADRAAIGLVLRKLLKNGSSYMFRQPVDPVRDNAPDYLTIIKSPMDLSTAKAKLDNGMYTGRTEFAADMRQIVQNCLTYNSPGTQVYKMGQQFESYFNSCKRGRFICLADVQVWSKTEAALNNPKAAERAKPEPPVGATIPTPSPVASVPPSSAPVKLKLKPPKTVSIDTTPRVPPMAPPPLPPSRKPSGSITPSAPDITRKRKESVKAASDLDDLLGAEIDAIERVPQRDLVEELLEPAPKKIKIKQRAFSPEKQSQTIKIKQAPVPASAPAPAPAPPPPPPVVQPALAPTLPAAKYTLPKPPPDLPPTKDNPMAFKSRRAKVLVGLLQKSPQAAIFLRPVDPIADGCPTYLQEIKEPMDFGTISKKIDQKKYHTMGELAYDIELVFKNCRTFNVPGDPITLLADAVEAIYWREWPKAVSLKMSFAEKQTLSSTLAKALKEPISLYFREAVDPIALGIPHYFTVIPPEDARDLGLIKRQLDKGQYATVQKVDEEIDLMLENAYSFNGEGPVVDAGRAFKKWWEQQRQKIE